MSTWINRVAAVFLLAACVPVGPETDSLPERARFLEGAVTVSAPAGYCIVPRASRASGDSVVALIGRCTEGSGAQPALITVSIGGAGSAAVLASGSEVLSDYFTSSAGRAALSRDGRASSVKVLRASLSGKVFVMHLSDQRVGRYWRAIFALGDRLVTLSVLPQNGASLSEAAGRKLLTQAVSAMRAGNPR